MEQVPRCETRGRAHSSESRLRSCEIVNATAIIRLRMLAKYWLGYSSSSGNRRTDADPRTSAGITCSSRRRKNLKTIPSGAKGSFQLVVTPEHLANRFKDAMLPPVLATPVMIMIMENAALNAMKPYLDASESAVSYTH